jgi:exonuclease VII large subunit
VSPLAEVVGLPPGARVAVQARVARFWTFVSRKGHTNLKFVLDDGTAQVECIMFEGTATPWDRRHMQSGGELRVEGRTDRYNGQPSLVVTSVEEGS